MANAIERYVELASGITNITVQAAERLVQRLVKEGEVAADRAERAVSDLLDASQRNRQALVQLIRHEVERAVDRAGLVRRSDLEDLEQRLLVAMRGGAPAGTGSAAAKRAATAKKTVAAPGIKRQSTPRKATGEAASSPERPAGTSAGTGAAKTPRKRTAQKTSQKATVATKTSGKKSAAKRSPRGGPSDAQGSPS